MKQIQLTKGKFAIVDDVDFEWLSQWKWYSNNSKWGDYANRQKMEKGKITHFYMHREIMKYYGYKIEGFFIDHINHNSLDNRKENLRLVNDSQSQMNRKITNKVGFKGVNLYRNGKWRAFSKINQKQIHLGYFNTKEEAAQVYNNFAIKNFKEYAFINKI
jgi:hypothetical protein